MNILDRYVLRQFMQVFFICWFSLTGLYIVFDAFSNLDEFINYAEGHGSLLQIMAEYYTYRVIYFFDRISAVLAMISAMFTVTWIQRHNELTAIMAAGISRRRVVIPVIIAAATISFLSMINRELVIPGMAGKLNNEATNLGGEMAVHLQPRYDHENEFLFRGVFTYVNERRISNPNFLLRPALDPESRQLVAENAYYQEADDKHPAGYLFRGVSQPVELLQGPTLRLHGRPVVITPHDASDWLKPNECFVASNVNFDLLTGGKQWKSFSSIWQLIRGLHEHADEFGADVRVAIHSRMLQPFLDVCLLLLGLPTVLQRETRNMFVSIGTASLMVFGFTIVVLGCQQLGANLLMRPVLAAWLPAMIFVPMAVALYDRVDR